MSPSTMPSASLRVAMVAPPWFDVPPSGYGGIEAMMADLIRALVARGHDITLIGAGRNGTPARFFQTYEVPPSKRIGELIPELAHTTAVARVLAGLDVDVIHDHSTCGPLTAPLRAVPTVMTAHGPADGELVDYYGLLASLDRVALVAISDAQRALAPGLNWFATVHNGIDVDAFPYRQDKEDWVLFLGRFNPHKGTHLAIDAARAAGRRIMLAGKVYEPVEREYFADQIKPRLGTDAEYVGEADTDLKLELLAKARCLVFPLQWEEPFGLVMVEAMACGTPVVAFPRGPVPEIVVEGVTGLLCHRPEELPGAIEAVGQIRPAACRQHVERHFDVAVMAEGYEKVYEQLLTADRRKGLSFLETLKETDLGDEEVMRGAWRCS